MKHLVFHIAMITACLAAGDAYAQRIPVRVLDTLDKKDSVARPVYRHKVTLGSSGPSGGSLSKATFDTLLLQGLHIRDPKAEVTGFLFNYMERNLYEDSVGKIMIVSDFLTEYCPGNRLPESVLSTIFQKTKRGDTAYFDNIRISWPDSTGVGRSMKFVIE